MKPIQILIPALLWVAVPFAAAAAEWTTVTGHLRVVTGAHLSATPNTRMTVAAVDEAGRMVSRQAVDDAFRLQLVTGHTYSLRFTGEDETVATLVWGDEATTFRAGASPIDLGWVGVNPTTHRGFALREVDLRPASTETVVAAEEYP